ncbi:Deoxyribonuclease-2-alpha [Trichinella britovi]|uniref:Deoxyribonuclease-2-alpha n=1 Tax=Trichinella britovi TaxID=45882 RepID=A0A0V1C7K8_TRIBR|nr:Deoxyribonuclease-2-alpha [Trichinella britovi]
MNQNFTVVFASTGMFQFHYKFKTPAQNTGKALIAGAAGAWQDTVAVTGANGHSFAKALEHVIAPDNTNKFIVYNNIPPDIPKVKTKSNSKGVLMMNPNAADDASWIVHTVPGFPKALRGYVFPPAEIQKGHLLICFTIKGSEIDTIAMALRIATPLIYHNDIPDAQINSRPNLKKLVNGESRLTPPLTVTRQISTAAAAGLKVTIYSKSEKSKYASPIAVNGDASSLDSDVSQWLISDPGNKFCAIDKPYHKSQTKEPAMAVCIDDATIFGHFNLIGQNIGWIFVLCFTFPRYSVATSKCHNLNGVAAKQHQNVITQMVLRKQIAPTRNMGKALIAAAMGWQDTPDLTMSPANVVAKPLEHVIAANDANKFIAYNNIPPDIPKVKTKSNSKGVLMMNPNAADDASWIVHTVPGFPKALRGYVFPPAEIQKGHLFICLTIKGSEIDAIAMALRFATPLIYHNDIPDAQINSRPNLKKLVDGESRLTPPLIVTRKITTAAAAGLKVTIYSKGEKSKYGE